MLIFQGGLQTKLNSKRIAKSSDALATSSDAFVSNSDAISQ